MKELIPLIKIISEQKIEQIDLFNSKVQLPFKSRLLYESIISDNQLSETEAILKVYESIDDRPKFLKLKTRLKKRLFNTLFFIDQSRAEFTDIRKAVHRVSRDYVLVNILKERKKSIVFFSLAKRAYVKARKYELTDYALLLARSLHVHYCMISPSLVKKNKIEKEMDQLSITLAAELKAEKYYNIVSYIYITKRANFSKAELAQIRAFSIELHKIQRTVKSYLFNFNAYNITSSYYILSRQYKKSVICSNEALLFFENKPFDTSPVKFSFRNNLILSAIGQKKYQLAEIHNSKNFEVIIEASFNWYTQCAYRFIILSAQKRYEDLYSLLLQVIHSKNYKKLPIQHQYWNVIEAYIHFLIRMDKINPLKDNSGKKLKPFSLSRFLNDVPAFTKDKRGMNISILIIQFLFLLLDEKYSKLIDRLDALKMYSYRYLKNNETYRSNLFIKMLLKLAVANFHPIAVERHTRSLYAKLQSSNPNANFLSNEIEVIPYENLWQVVMELLEKNKS